MGGMEPKDWAEVLVPTFIATFSALYGLIRWSIYLGKKAQRMDTLEREFAASLVRLEKVEKKLLIVMEFQNQRGWREMMRMRGQHRQLEEIQGDNPDSTLFPPE